MDSKSQASKKMSVDDAMSVLLSELPQPVRDFVTSPERARIALSLTYKHRLHADEAGEFERAYMFMLLGISSPEEFVDTLTKAGIPPETVRALAQDVNEQVFVPLRKAEQAPQRATVAPTQAVTLPGSSIPVPPPVPHRQEVAPLVPPPSLVPLPQTVPQMPQYMYPPAQMPQQMMYMPQYGVPYGPTPMYVWPPQAPQPWPVPQGMSAEHLHQLASQHQASVMSPVPAPEASKPQVREPERPPYVPPPHPVAPLIQTQPLAKEYVADPYREGI